MTSIAAVWRLLSSTRVCRTTQTHPGLVKTTLKRPKLLFCPFIHGMNLLDVRSHFAEAGFYRIFEIKYLTLLCRCGHREMEGWRLDQQRPLSDASLCLRTACSRVSRDSGGSLYTLCINVTRNYVGENSSRALILQFSEQI
jgi:hypothetical protein